jgi:hypothetical protein
LELLTDPETFELIGWASRFERAEQRQRDVVGQSGLDCPRGRQLGPRHHAYRTNVARPNQLPCCRPSCRAAVGVYRSWRDLGFAIGAVVVGLIADATGIASAIWVVAAITSGSGVVVLIRMRETRPAS